MLSNPSLSIPRRSLELGISHTSLHCILHKDLGLKAEKFQLTGLSIPRRSLELGIPQTSLHRILHKDLGLKAKKFTEEIKPTDHQQRRVFADWVL